MSVTFVVICGCYQCWFLLTNNLTEYNSFETPYFIAIYAGIIYPWFNIWGFIILFFYKFSTIEIISETGLFTILISSDMFINKDELILPCTISLMLLYIALKKITVKLYLKRRERDLQI